MAYQPSQTEVISENGINQTFVKDETARDLLYAILVQLKHVNKQLSIMTDTMFKDSEV